MTDNTQHEFLNLSENLTTWEQTCDKSNVITNDQNMTTISNIHCQKKNPHFVKSVKYPPNQLSMPSIDILSKEKVKRSPKTEMKSKNKSSVTCSPNKSAVRNVFDKKCSVLFTEKGNNKSHKKVSAGKICFRSIPKAKDSIPTKRHPPDITGGEINETRPCKKARFDENMNTENLEDCDTHGRKCWERTSRKETGMDRASCMLTATGKYNSTGFSDNTCISKISRTLDSVKTKDDTTTEVEFKYDIKNRSCAERQPNLEDSKSSLEKSEMTQTLNKERPDSGFQETFSILEEFSDSERQCSTSFCSSPDLVSPVSSHTSSSTGLTSSSNSRTCSPDLQSSITKYFTPLKARETSHSPRNNVNLTPPPKQNLKVRKNISPSSSPASGKKEQMYLDLGQKDFGHVTCPTCNMVYTRAQPEDESDHLKFHRKFVTGLRFLGWKTERVVEQFDDGRVIVVLPNDHFTHQKKVTDVRRVVDNELGFSSETSLRMQDAQTYMFITNRKVIGCVVAVEIQKAYHILPSEAEDYHKTSDMPGAWCCSSTPVRAQCGISRVWVLQQYRRKGIATRLLECVRKHFMFGCVVAKESLAFSDPTPLGKRLAESYSGTESFLVFR